MCVSVAPGGACSLGRSPVMTVLSLLVQRIDNDRPARGSALPMAGLQANGPAPAPGMWAHWTGGRGRAAMDDQWSLASAETESCRAPQAGRRPSARAQ